MNKVKNSIRKGFTTIPNELINDDSLTDRARFLFCYMASKPDDWKFYQEPLCKSLGYSLDTLRKYIDELLKSGWITRQLIRQEGRFDSFEYDLLPSPCGKNTDSVKNRDGEKPSRENSALTNKDLEQKKTDTKKERETPAPQIETKPILTDIIEKLKQEKPGRPEAEYRIGACYHAIMDHIEKYPAYKHTILALVHSGEKPDTKTFQIEVMKCVRYNCKDAAFLSDPVAYIPKLLPAWFERWDKWGNATVKKNKQDGLVYVRPKDVY